jgi:hypothetical protein
VPHTHLIQAARDAKLLPHVRRDAAAALALLAAVCQRDDAHLLDAAAPQLL